MLNVWIDNTGLQSASACVYGTARDQNDALGLVQFATLIVFAETIRLNGFEHPTVYGNSATFIERLRTIDLDPGVIDIASVDRSTYAYACRKAAEEACLFLQDKVSHGGDDLVGGIEPDELPRGAYEQQIGFANLLDAEKTQLKDVSESALDSHAIGAVDYMVAESASLRRALKDISRDAMNLYRTNIYLRFHLNRQLSALHSSYYAPAIGRARLVNRQLVSAVALLDRQVSTVVDEFRHRLGVAPLGIPAVGAYLLSKGKGEPESILVEAGELRSRLSPLRKRFASVIDRGNPAEVGVEVAEIGDQLEKELRTSQSRSDAVSVVRIIESLSELVSNPVGFLKAGRELGSKTFSSQRMICLTDIVRDIALYEPERDFRRLMSHARRKSE